MIDPEKYVEAGQALIGLGRMLQKTFPQPTIEGSQFQEDLIIENLLPGDSGLYVEIGANHGIDTSNTYRFYKKGWRGLLIEPLIYSLPSLLLDRVGDFICPLAASNEDGYATLHLCRSVSSLDPKWRIDNDGTMPVRTEKLSTILRRYPSVDWTKTRLCSLDVEGWEKQVLLGIDWATFHPDVFIVEYAGQDGRDLSGEWLPLLTANGYREVHRNRLNLILQLTTGKT